jgi:hypothetical protein
MSIGFIHHEKDTKLCAKSVGMDLGEFVQRKNSIRLY